MAPIVGAVTYGPEIRDPFESLRPFAADRTERWARRWTLILGEIARRSEIMGLEPAVASVCDDLVAGRFADGGAPDTR